MNANCPGMRPVILFSSLGVLIIRPGSAIWFRMVSWFAPGSPYPLPNSTRAYRCLCRHIIRLALSF